MQFKRLRSAMNRTVTSLGSIVSPQLQWAQFFIAFILPWRTHAAGSRWYFQSVDRLCHHEQPCVRSKGLRSAMKRTVTSPDSVLGSQLHWAWLTIAYISPETTHSLFIHGTIPHKSRNPYTFNLLGVCEQLNFSSEANIRWCITYVSLIAHQCDAQIFSKNYLVPSIRQKAAEKP